MASELVHVDDEPKVSTVIHSRDAAGENAARSCGECYRRMSHEQSRGPQTSVPSWPFRRGGELRK